MKLFESVPSSTYIVVKNMRTDSKHFVMETNNLSMMSYINVKIIYPEESATFQMYHDEIAEDEFECENNMIWRFFYRTKDLVDAKERCDLMNEGSKYNM